MILLILRQNARTTDVTFQILTSLVADVICLVPLHKMTFDNVTAKQEKPAYARLVIRNRKIQEMVLLCQKVASMQWYFSHYIIKVATVRNRDSCPSKPGHSIILHDCMCAQRILKSAHSSAIWSKSSLGTLWPRIQSVFRWTARTLIRQRRCASWSESLALSLWYPGSNCKWILNI